MKTKPFLQALIVVLALLAPPETWASCTCARFNDFQDMGCHKTPGGAGAPPSGANDAGGNNAPCPTCPPAPDMAGPDNGNPVSDIGMPRWWVDEPYINLHVVDTPLSYRTSSGQPVNFSFNYKQRFSMPKADQVGTIYNVYLSQSRIYDDPYVYRMRSFGDTNAFESGMTNAAWMHNWMMNVVYWDAAWESNYYTSHIPIGSPFANNYEALVFSADGSTSYFTSNAVFQTLNATTQTTDPLTQVQFVPFPGSHPNLTNNPTADAHGIYWGSTTNGLKLVYPDGSQDVFGLCCKYEGGGLGFNAPDTTAEALLTQRIDPQGRTTKLGYEFTNYSFLYVYRLKYVVDSDGRTNTFVYTPTSNPWTLQEIDDPFGRKASFSYLSSSNWLTNITDAAGNSSSFTYATNGSFPFHTLPSGWLAVLTTPYGPTGFSYYQVPDTNNVVPADGFQERATLVSEPESAHQLFYYKHIATGMVETTATPPSVPGLAFDDGTTGGSEQTLDRRDSFHWDRKQFANLSATVNNANQVGNMGSADYQKATMQRWLAGGPSLLSITEMLSSERDPSPDPAGATEGNRTWLAYTNSTPYAESTSQIAALAQILPDGTTNYTRYYYYSSGLVSSNTQTYSKPDGSVGNLTNYFHYTNANVDLYSVSNSLGQFAGAGYNTNHQVTSLTNALNEVTTLAWRNKALDGDINLSSISFSSGESLSLGYFTPYVPGYNTITNTTGFLNTIAVQPENKTTTITDYTNALPHIVNVSGTGVPDLWLTNTWDGLNRRTGTVFQDLTTVSNVYTSLDLTARKDRMGQWTYLGFDGLDHLVEITNALTGITTLTWCSCGSLMSVTDPLGKTTTLNYNNQEQVTNVVFPDGSSVTNQFDFLGRLTNRIDGAGKSFSFQYNNQSLLTAINNTDGQALGIGYDAVNRPVAITNADNVVWTRAYDLLDRVITNAWPDGTRELFQYAANGLIAYTNQDGEFTLFLRDGAGRVTKVTNNLSQITQFGYNALDEISSLTDGLTHATTWQYNQYGWMTNKLNNLSASVQTNSFDANGRLTTRWMPASGLTSYQYDALGNLTNISYPHRTNSYAYDADRRLTNILDAVGVDTLDTGLTFTTIGELAGEIGPWASNTVSYTYNQRHRASLSLNSQIPTLSHTYNYDSVWRLQSLASLAGTFTYTAGGTGSASALVKSVALPNGATVTNQYDALARLTNTALLNQWGHPLDGYGYILDAWGLRTNITRQLGLSSNSVSALYDGIGQLTNWTAKETGGVSRQNEQLAYSYDAAGNLSVRTNGLLIQTFTVDTLNQIGNVARTGLFTETGATPAPATTVAVNGVAAQTYGDFTFARTNITLNNGNNTFTNNATNAYGVAANSAFTLNLPTPVNFQYDANGNLTNDGTRWFFYDGENQLTNVEVSGQWQVSFVFDGLNRRRIERDYAWVSGAWSKTNETRFLYDGMQVLQERDTNNNPLVTYTRGLDLSSSLSGAGGIGGLLARTDANGPAFYHSDGAGNVTALMDGNQNIVARYEYDAFGRMIGRWGTLATANKVRFSSMPASDIAGVVGYSQRFYDPNLQRWLNRDPIRENGGINLYRFVHNRPTMEVDPLGLITPDLFEQEMMAQMMYTPGDWNYYADPDGSVTRAPYDWGLSSTDFDFTPVVLGELPIVGKMFAWAKGLLGDGLDALGDALGELKPKPAVSCPAKPKWKMPIEKGAPKMERQMEQRGWTPQDITDAIENGQNFPAPNNVNPNNLATRYVNPNNGQSVVVDDVTGEVLHVGGPGFKY